MKIFSIAITSFTITAASLLSVATLHAAEDVSSLTIQDTSGFTRAVGSVENSGEVQFSLVDQSGAAVNGGEVTLTNAQTGQVLTTQVTSGTATFTGVAPGTWTVATTVPGITFTNVAITGGIVAGGITTATAAGAVLVAGGVAGGTVAIVDATEDNDKPLSPAR